MAGDGVLGTGDLCHQAVDLLGGLPEGGIVGGMVLAGGKQRLNTVG